MQYKEKIIKNLYRISNPERYTGNEWNSIKKEWTSDKLKIALAFPDVYELAMSHLGLKILYHLINKEENFIAERAYAPWIDMEELMREIDIPLFTLESYHEIKDFDLIGFTLQYEMSYTNILNMIDLSGISIYSSERQEGDPLVIAGGANVFNPEPVADFIDLFFIGEAEDLIIPFLKKYQELKDKAFSRSEILVELNKLSGVYVPSLYDVSYSDRKILKYSSFKTDKEKVEKQLVKNLDQAFYPVDFLVPYKDTVHDRIVLEISRGCTRSCRFCEAGMTYRPVRERSIKRIVDLAERAVDSTGFEEISLTSLSTVDYIEIKKLVKEMSRRFSDRKISISLSSLRVDKFSVELAEEVQKVRKTGLTFAPEAGSQRLRDVINKNVDEEELYSAARSAFESGWSKIKLYFMIGLPTETMEDLEGIVRMARKVLDIGRKIRKNTSKKMRRIEISVSVSTFIPKPFTPFQWVKMDEVEEIIEKQNYLRDNLRGRGLNFSWNDPELSRLEGVIARGDRRIASVIADAWKKGSRFEGWNELFKPRLWGEAFRENDINPGDYLCSRDEDELFPWEILDIGVNREFLLNEYKKSFNGERTADCRFEKCTGCAVCDNFSVDLELMSGDGDAL